MWGLLMLLVALIGGFAINSMPRLSSPPTQVMPFGMPANPAQARAMAVADNLVLAMHEAQSACDEQHAPVAVCSGGDDFTASNTGTNGPVSTNITNQQGQVPMLSPAASGSQGHIYTMRSGMYVVVTWAPPQAASPAYKTQICTLATAYLRNRLGAADWVGSYDAAAGAVRIWFGVAVPRGIVLNRTAQTVSIPLVAQTGMTDGCPAYVEPIQN